MFREIFVVLISRIFFAKHIKTKIRETIFLFAGNLCKDVMGKMLMWL